MYRIDFHADDYGISENNCIRILELVREGHLDSFSIIPNMSSYEKCMEILKAQWDSLPEKPLISVHINLIGGLSISGKCDLYNSWGEIFKIWIMGGAKRRDHQEKIKAEIYAQIKRVYEDIRSLPGIEQGIRLDTHIHTHMIPMVFDAMLEAADCFVDEKRNSETSTHISFVRLSAEPLYPFLSTAGVTFTFPVVNAVKNIIIRVLSGRADKILSRRGIEHGMLFGLCLSGNMDARRMSLILPKIIKKAKKNDMYLEVLAHPGIVLANEALPEFGPDDKKAFLAKGRDIEFEGMKACGGQY